MQQTLNNWYQSEDKIVETDRRARRSGFLPERGTQTIQAQKMERPRSKSSIARQMPGYISKKQVHPVSGYTCLVFWFVFVQSSADAEHPAPGPCETEHAVSNKKEPEHLDVFGFF